MLALQHPCSSDFSTVDVNVTALTATSGAEAIKLTYTGTAPGYFPQADSATYPVKFWARGTVTIGTVASSGLVPRHSLLLSGYPGSCSLALQRVAGTPCG